MGPWMKFGLRSTRSSIIIKFHPWQWRSYPDDKQRKEIIFEVKTVVNASPATVTRAGISHVSETDLMGP